MLRKQNRLAELRPDELELLSIAAEGGGTGVAAALRDPTKVLPALAAMGIGLETLSSEASRDGGETPLLMPSSSEDQSWSSGRLARYAVRSATHLSWSQ